MKKQIESSLYSVIGVFVMLIILIAVYVISGFAKQRIDLTQEKLNTLSHGTKAILSRIDTPIEIRFYCTQDSKDMPVPLKVYAQRIEDLLFEYKKAAKSKITIRKMDPRPDSDAEEAAGLDGVEGQTASLGEKVYLGLAVSMLDSTSAIPFLSPEREKLLEYDISRAISRVMTTEKAVVGVMSPLQVFGEFNPMAMRMGQMQRQEPWVFIGELKRDYEVKQIDMTVDQIPPEVKVLVVVHPKGITDKTQYALDQFVLRGGKLVAFVDPLSLVDSRNNQGNPMQAAAQGGSNLEKLFKAWGVNFDPNKVAADMRFVTRINRGNRAEEAPAVLSMTAEGINREDVVTGQIDNLLLPFGGAFSGTPAEGLKRTVLVKTTSTSQMVDRFMAEFSGEQIAKDFTSSGNEQALAIRLVGKFKTAYPEGKPKDTSADKHDADDDKPAPDAAAGAGLKESSTDGVVVLVGDADLLFDQFSVQVQEFFGQRIVIPRNGNLSLVQNIVDQLAGDNNLITVRSRATLNRPFTVVRKMQAQAEERHRSKIKELEQGLQDAQGKLNELQRKKEAGQRFILSAEQQAEIKKFQEKEAQVRKELKMVRKNLRRDIDSMENRLKWMNIAGMPILVTLSGVLLAVFKRKKTAAK